MKTLIDLIALFAGVFLAFVVQHALPPMDDLQGARVVLVPLVFCYAAIVLPFPAMLAAAFYTGFFSDLFYLHIVGGAVEIPMGISIIYYVILGCLASRFRSGPETAKMWMFSVLSGAGTCAFLLLQFLMITWHRGGWEWAGAAAWRILAPGLMAALIAPLFHLVVSHIDNLIPDFSRMRRVSRR
jgi:cell shape-determining protein MreD